MSSLNGVLIEQFKLWTAPKVKPREAFRARISSLRVAQRRSRTQIYSFKTAYVEYYCA